MTPTSAPASVNRFEFHLLQILQCLVGSRPVEQTVPLLDRRMSPPPRCLSGACVRLIEDTLRKGLILDLVRNGGWRTDRFLRMGQPIAGRVWERIPLEERVLSFSPRVMEFLVWLTAELPTDPRTPWPSSSLESEVGDELFFAMAYDRLRELPHYAGAFSGKLTFSRNALCRLLHPADFVIPTESLSSLFEPWMQGVRAAILECWQPLLHRCWLTIQRGKGQIRDWEILRVQSLAEQATLTGFLEAAAQSGRTDLARFVLRTAESLLRSSNLTASFWIGGLTENRPNRLGERVAIERAALGLLQQIETLQQWERRARAVGYFDEDYAASQFWKAEWEAAHGDELADRARAILAEANPLQTG